MARVRPSTAGLSRLLNSVTQPLYVLDARQRIVFCNNACLDWVGQNPQDLLGQHCTYYSGTSASGPEAVAARLCPPPLAWHGRQTIGFVASLEAAGQLRRRQARFVPFGDNANESAGLIVLVEPDDAPANDDTARCAQTDEAAELHHRVLEFHAAATRCDRLLGDSPAMRRARAQVELASGNRASVLIVGPIGSGCQLIAEAIHYGSRTEPRGTLIPIACSLLGSELIQSALTAASSRSTLGDKAATSTLLLNDVDLLPIEVQAHATAILTGRSFPLRIVATARQPLSELAQRGQFRPDLAAALGTLVIELPPLAERRQDIPVLAQLFLEEANARGHRQLSGFTPEALDCLDAYPWPGNVDELVLMVSEAHQRAEGSEIGVAALPQRLHLAASAAACPRIVEPRIVLDEFLARIERELIGRALARAKGNKTKAAKLLGMTRPRLYRRLVQLGMEQSDDQ